ncbi:hypothetical protein EMPS_08451 [Entomortierella parvispora]|uniref:Cas12f1-like TNB domain-containing protein n=1 Tax=Entomortierella parvispora TaxID=205924 RepID=A0A9P3HG94_9FUNG|nr:hypothetical protein EMPS_08451 [Entomortierella parvispora]
MFAIYKESLPSPFLSYKERGWQTFDTNAGQSSAVQVVKNIKHHYRTAKINHEVWPKSTKNDYIAWFFQHNKGQFADYVQGKIASQFTRVDSADLFRFLAAKPPGPNTAEDPILKQLLHRIFGADKPNQNQRVRYVTKHKGWLFSQILYKIDPPGTTRFRRYHRKARLQDDEDDPNPLVLGQSFQTNGRVLNIQVSDTRRPKPKKKKKSEDPDSQDPADDKDDEEDDEDDDEDDGGDGDDDFFDYNEDDDPNEMQPLKDDDYEDHEEAISADADKQTAQTGVASQPTSMSKNPGPVTFNNGSTYTFGKGSATLPNASVFDFGDITTGEVTVIGIDPGEVFSMTATRLRLNAEKSGTTNDRASKRIRRSFLYHPVRLFQEAVRVKKVKEHIHLLETNIPPYKPQSILERMRYLHSPAQQVLGRLLGPNTTVPNLQGTVKDVLFDFYHSPWMLKRKWDMRKAQQRAIDLAMDQIFKLAGVLSGRKADGSAGTTVVFALGLGSFNSRTGLPSKHGPLERRFTQRARRLGYIVVGVDEYYTSAKCLRQNCDAFLQYGERRSKYCTACKQYFDRDVVGSENIAYICMQFILGQERPPKFCPIPEPFHLTVTNVKDAVVELGTMTIKNLLG